MIFNDDVQFGIIVVGCMVKFNFTHTVCFTNRIHMMSRMRTSCVINHVSEYCLFISLNAKQFYNNKRNIHTKPDIEFRPSSISILFFFVNKI